jgi:hypothetical protein
MEKDGLMTECEFPNQTRDAERAVWHRYIDFLAPFRPDLYRFLQTAHR